MSVTFKTASEAAVAFTTTKIDKATLLNYAKTIDMVGVLTLLQAKALTIEEASPLLNKPEKAPGSLTCKTGKKGGISVYGLQRMPVTAYASQWERFLAYVGAASDNPIAKHIAEDKPQEFDFDSFKLDDDKKLLEEIKAGKHPHASVVGTKVVCRLSRKS